MLGKLFGLIGLFLALALGFHSGAVAKSSKPEIPGERTVTLLIRYALIGIDQANRTGNYTVLRDLAAPGFRAQNTAASLAMAFSGLRRNVDLSSSAIAKPILTEPPTLGEDGILHIKGYVDVTPKPVRFDLGWQASNGGWILYGIALSPGEKVVSGGRSAITGSGGRLSKQDKIRKPDKRLDQ
ncbi:MAG: hypothetical protein V6Z86_00825 [Hyphomicrobiales bacterium]